jgi:DNA polymerase-3 subunit gamma/tau
VGCPPEQLLHVAPSQAAQVAELGQRLGVETLLAVVQILEQTLTRMRLSVHGRTLVETAVVRICKLEDLDELATLIAGLREGGSAPAAAAGPRSASKKNVARADNSPSSPVVPPSAVALQTSATSRSAATPPPGGRESVGGSAGPLTDLSAAAIWKQVVDRLTDENELVADQAALFERLATSAPNSLVVSFPAKYNSCKSFCEQPLQRGKLEQALAEVVGETVRLEFELVEDEASAARPERAPSRREMQAEVMGRPFVRRAMELFDAPECRVDPPDASA